MRSGLVFNVSTRIPNRFLLCRMLAASARKMHRDGISTSQSINNSLAVLGGSTQSQEHGANKVGVSDSSNHLADVAPDEPPAVTSPMP